MKVDLTDIGLINDLDEVLLGNKKMVELEITTQTSEPMCDKNRDIGIADSYEQNEYIDIRTNNREYLKELFDRYDEDEIKELLTENGIDEDVLEGDGVSNINYALKELIEKGKIKAVNYNEELKKAVDYDEELKKKKRKRSTSNSSSSEHMFNKAKTKKTMRYKAKKKKYKAKTLRYKAKTKKPMRYKATLKNKKGLLLSSSNSSNSSSSIA